MAIEKKSYACEHCGHTQIVADFDVCPVCGWSHSQKKYMFGAKKYILSTKMDIDKRLTK